LREGIVVPRTGTAHLERERDKEEERRREEGREGREMGGKVEFVSGSRKKVPVLVDG